MTTYTSVGKKSPDTLIGTTVTVKGVTGVVEGWHRTNTSASGQRWGLGCCYTDIALDLADGRAMYVTLITDYSL